MHSGSNTKGTDMNDYPGAPLHIRLSMLREAAGMSLSQLARKSGVARSAIHSTERGKTSPSYDTVCKLGEALDVRPAALTDGLYDIDDDVARLQREYGAWL